MLLVICPDCGAAAERYKEPYICYGMPYDGTIYRYVCPRCGRAGGVGMTGKVATGREVSVQEAVLIAADKFLYPEKYQSGKEFSAWKKPANQGN